MALSPKELEARRQGIGGSDAGAVCGLSERKSPLKLYYEKRGEAPLDDEETEAMEWGKLLEGPIAEKFAAVTGLKIRKQPMKTATKHKFMLANIDRQIVKPAGILECKNLNFFTKIETVADLPDDLYMQGQHYYEVYGYETGLYFAILIGGQHFVQFPIERDQQTIEILIECEAEFWRRVELGDPPPVDGSDGTKELAKRLWPKDTGQIISLPSDDAADTARGILQLKDEIAALEDRKSALENWFKWKMRDASVCKLPLFGEITWKSTLQHVEEIVDTTKLEQDFPEAHKACVSDIRKGGGRRFLVKPQKGLVKT